MNKWRFAAIAAAILTSCHLQGNPLFAADHLNLEENLPLEVTDAIPTAYLNREIQGAFYYERTDGSKDKYTPELRLEYGVFLNTQVEAHVPYQFGTAVDNGLGVAEASVLYNFNQESLWIPATALSAHALFPTAKNTGKVDPKIKWIMTKTVGRSSFFQRVHVNLGWRRNNNADDEKRKNLYSWILGYDCILNPESILIFDFVREQLPEKGKDSNIVEIGIRYQLHPRAVLSIGVGTGIGEDSPDVRATIGFQYSF